MALVLPKILNKLRYLVLSNKPHKEAAPACQPKARTEWIQPPKTVQIVLDYRTCKHVPKALERMSKSRIGIQLSLLDVNVVTLVSN